MCEREGRGPGASRQVQRCLVPRSWGEVARREKNEGDEGAGGWEGGKQSLTHTPPSTWSSIGHLLEQSE